MTIKPDTWPTRAFWVGFAMRMVLGVLVVFAIFAAWLVAMPENQRDAIVGYWSRVRVPAPSFDAAPLLAAPLSVQIHVAAALAAMAVGATILLLSKGSTLHRLLGWSWVGSMIIVAATSIMMIFDFNTGINPLHAFTALTAISLWGGACRHSARQCAATRGQHGRSLRWRSFSGRGFRLYPRPHHVECLFW